MEDVLSVSHLPYNHNYPIVCMDESNKQLVGEVRTPIPGKPGQPKRIDDEYVRNGVAEIFMEVEPLAGKRHVAVTERRTRKDWAHQIKSMLDERYPEAIKVRLIMDNLNTHNIASLYETFEPQEAQRLASRLEIHHTPINWGSAPNPAEGMILPGPPLVTHCNNKRGCRRIISLPGERAGAKPPHRDKSTFPQQYTIFRVSQITPCAKTAKAYI
jgi:hypothetical protein